MQSASVGERSASTSGPEGRDEAGILIHGSAVRLRDKGVLLIGPSASGKSDLALCLIEAGATLIADDQLWLSRCGDRLHARPPDRLAGLIALRGIGIMRLPFDAGPLDLAVELLASDAAPEPLPESLIDPLPEPATASWLGIDLPKIDLDARAPSAVARIKLMLHAERVY